jgi:hypothetical protein
VVEIPRQNAQDDLLAPSGAVPLRETGDSPCLTATPQNKQPTAMDGAENRATLPNLPCISQNTIWASNFAAVSD